jgi:hypothetical protein
MAKLSQTPADLMKHLEEQLAFIRASCASFDAGSPTEAKRIALQLRIMLHDTETSSSLLGQLGLKKILFLDTASDWDPRDLMSHHGLVAIQTTTGVGASYSPKFVAGFHRTPTLATFDDWWAKTVIVDSKKNRFSRRDIILSVVNKDGGAHIDPELEDPYAQLTRFNSVGWVVNIDGTERDLPGVELASIRQIAWEFLESLKRASVID